MKNLPVMPRKLSSIDFAINKLVNYMGNSVNYTGAIADEASEIFIAL